ncbi:MAG: transposase [Planctomycetota bacterium]
MTLIERACQRIAVRVLAWCLMPNHFHFVLWPRNDGDMSRWMHWLLSSHVRWYHRRYGTSGRIWQGRFKSFPIEQDEHLLKVMRYVERNPLRAQLVARAEEWPWSSLQPWMADSRPDFLHDGPFPRWLGWPQHVNEPQTQAELLAIRNCVNREAPFGTEGWANATAENLGLSWTMRDRGRPSSAPKRRMSP